MIEPGQSNPRARRALRAHGWSRTNDQPLPPPAHEAHQQVPKTAISGLSVLVLISIVFFTTVGLAHVRMRTKVLELGLDLYELTSEHADLLDRKRRLEAERAYLRHPNHVFEIAREQLGMIPAAAERIQRIELTPGASTTESTQPR